MTDMQHNAMTPRQRQIYQFILDFTRRHTYQPSLRDIGAHFGIASANGVKCHIESLERKGYLEQTGKSRALVITDLLPADIDQESDERRES